MRENLRRPVLAIALAAAVSLTGVAAVKAGQGPGAGGHSYEKCDHKGHDLSMRGKAAWRKTLTAAQKTELAGMHEALKKETAGLKDELWARKEAARAIVASDNPDRDALGRITGEIAGLEKKLMDAKYGHMMKVRSILSAEQKAAFDASMKMDGKRAR